MSWRVHDIFCNRCDVIEEALHEDGSIPDCPSCGGPRQTAWAIGSRTPAAHVFKPINLGYATVHSKAELNAEVERIKQRFPGRDVEIEGRDDSRNRVVAEEHYHRARQKRKQKGLDEHMMSEYKEDQGKLMKDAAKAAESANEDPNKAAQKAAKDMGSPAALAGWKT